MSFLYRHRKALLLVGGVVVVLGVVGAVGSMIWTHHFTLPRGMVCGYHGAKAWIAARHHHPGWTAFHLWRATHDCHAAGWRY